MRRVRAIYHQLSITCSTAQKLQTLTYQTATSPGLKEASGSLIKLQ